MTITRLRSVILGALSGKCSQQELFDELMAHKQQLLKIFDVGNRDPQQQKELESGKTVINGKSVAVNAEFARQVIFLSQQLECSERYVAGLLHAIMSDNPNIGPVNALELAVAEFHQQRRHLVDSLHYLLDAAQLAESTEPNSVYRRIEAFVRQSLIPGITHQGRETTLAYAIFQTIEHLANVIQRADHARTGAKSNTVVPSGQEAPSLGADILNARYDSLKYERRYLGECLFQIARLGHFSPNEVKVVVEWLSSNPNHSMTFYMLSAVLAAFDLVHPASFGSKSRALLANDRNTMAFMKQKFAPNTEWKERGLKSTVLMKWTLFLTEIRHRNAELEDKEGFRTDELEGQIRQAITGDVFSFLSLAVLQTQRRRGDSFTGIPSLLSSLTLSNEQQEQREVPSEDFKPFILQSFESLIRSLITHASSEIRKIKQRQEDLVLANSRTIADRTRQPSTSRFTSSDPDARNDIAMLYSFVGLLYSSLPDESALQFWGSGPATESSTYLEYLESTAGRLPAFLQWAVWSTQAQDATMSTALYDMIAGLAKGQQCAELAYNFIARGGNEVIPGSSYPSNSAGTGNLSWTVVFGHLETWAAAAASNGVANRNGQNLGLSNSGYGGGLSAASGLAASARAYQQQHQPQQIISPKEVLFAQAFLRLLSMVVTHSVAVRLAISSNANFRAIPTLLSLIPLAVPLELKGALFETLCAFCDCASGAGAPGVEICRAVWTLMERLEVINVRAGTGFGLSGFGGPTQVKGVEVELEEIEVVHGLYPATLPFLKLLTTLIHTPKRIRLTDRLSDSGVSLNTIPDALGQPYRLPGIGPFTSFVVDNVFAKISSREFLRPSDRWRMNDLCLCFVERTLASYDLESLMAAEETGYSQLKSDRIAPLLIHPGYDVMKRLLTNSTLQGSILSYIVDAVDGLEMLAVEEYYFQSTITRVLRIILRVLEIQTIFLDVLIPALSDMDNVPIVGMVHQPSYFTKLDKALSFGPQYVAAIASYVAYPAHSELVLLAVKILTHLSASPFFTNMAALVDRSNDSERIIAGFLRILTAETLDDVDEAEIEADQTTGAGAPDIDGPSSFDQATRLAALDLLIQNTKADRPYPNIAHFLLLGSAHDIQQIQDPHALGARQTCVHVLLDLLNTGVPRLRDIKEQPTDTPLFVTLPGLAERCYHVIYQLCAHPKTFDFTMRYLRTREDFFCRHLALIPSRAPETFAERPIQVQYNDGSRVLTTVPALSSFLRLQSWIFDLAALDLHVLTSKGHTRGVTELLEILFSNDPIVEETPAWEDELVQPFREVGQSNMRIIEFVQSLTFDWADNLTVQPVEIQLLKELNIHTCVRTDDSGCQVVDRQALLSLLTAAHRSLHAQNTVLTPAHLERLNAETAYILESCGVENHRRKVAHARGTGFEAWHRLLDTTLTKCFDRLPHDHRENMLFDLLHALPPIIRSSEMQESTAILVSEAVLSSITKLREDRRHQIILQPDPESGSLPVERLLTILRNILECILESNHAELIRGNLYASLINFIHLISSSPDHTPLTSDVPLALSSSSSSSSSMINDSQALVSSTRALAGSNPVTLRINSLAMMKNVAERLVVTVARDAIDGSEVWRTIAFMLLDSLVQLSGSEKQHVILTMLVRNGILANFVAGIRETDFLLQSVLRPDPDDLNPLYVYEAKMSLLIRMAQTRSGAERLLEAQIIPVLAQCDYLDTRPEADQSFMDLDTFLPSAIQRYHQLLMPALQLTNAMMATLGSKHSTASQQTVEFLSRHSATIVILLKSDMEDISLALVEELHLLVSLSTQVLPSVPKVDLASANSGFGAVHAAILNISAKCLGNAQWLGNVRPFTDIEVLNASVGPLGDTMFDKNVRAKEQLLRQSLVSYLGIASDFTEPEINLILSPLTMMTRHEERASHFLATIPSIGDAISVLTALCQDLSQTLKQISDISAEIVAKEHINVEAVHQIVRDVDTAIFQDLDISQKRTLVWREFVRMRGGMQDEARIIANTMEMLLLLLWRHISYYCTEGGLQTQPSTSRPAHSAMRLLSAPDPETFREEVVKALGPALARVQDLVEQGDVEESSGTTPGIEKGNRIYLETMCRRLRDVLGRQDAENGDMMR